MKSLDQKLEKIYQWADETLKTIDARILFAKTHYKA